MTVKKQLGLIPVLGLIFLTIGCTSAEVNDSQVYVSEATLISQTEVENVDSDSYYISEIVISWLGADDLHPLIVSIFPQDETSCPLNYHDMQFEQGVACARIKDGFEYRINNVIYGELLDSSLEVVE